MSKEDSECDASKKLIVGVYSPCSVTVQTENRLPGEKLFAYHGLNSQIYWLSKVYPGYEFWWKEEIYS